MSDRLDSLHLGLTRFFGSLAGLKELCWTTPGTTDPSMVAAALSMNVCSTLEVLEWTSFGYTSVRRSTGPLCLSSQHP
jgi:hypothetical protein